MTDTLTDPHRRLLLRAAASLALAPAAATAVAATAPAPKATAEPPPGKPGDFDFLAGKWKIQHRRPKADGKGWDEFEGEASCWTILGGVGSVEELRIPARNFSGMGLRLLDVEKKLWSDFWVNARSGVLTTPGTTGHFRDGVGTFVSEEMDEGKPILVRGLWDGIGDGRCRWQQAVSRDGGKTWDVNWYMDWTRVRR